MEAFLTARNAARAKQPDIGDMSEVLRWIEQQGDGVS
jgi:hypothetical protein